MFRRRSYGLVRSRPASGLALLRVPRACEPDVVTWCERDEAWPGSTRSIALDCTACGACCHGCRPVLRPDDLARWRAAGRPDLLGRRYVRRSGGVSVLGMRAADGACVHLNGARCDIYPIRPMVCRFFPMGSEGCLEARRLHFGLVDGRAGTT
jgi:Fe-S-cluster containining protein